MNPYERRIRAFSIDLSFATIVFLVLIALINYTSIESNQIKLLITSSVAYFGVLIIPNFFSKGQSFGKRVQKIKVVNVKTEDTPSMWILILREVVKGVLMISTYGLYLLVSGIMVNSRRDQRSPHDLLFHTKVKCLTLYVTDKEEGYVLGAGESARKNLEGSTYD